jgi:hypothetical protein
MSEMLFSDLNNKVGFLEHFLSSFEQNTHSASSETSLLRVQIQNTTGYLPPPPWLLQMILRPETVCLPPIVRLCRPDLEVKKLPKCSKTF